MAVVLENPATVPVGQINSFGEFGPKYQIGEPIRRLDNGDWMVRIVLIETGEEAEYRRSKILQDPKAT